ncbi:3-hydroxyacyl-ACP dehydratase FabZ [Algiphilus aromaticivorans]|uniref:3-hydroxyacyl-ACP dehydratase FabZ n=1 Tax=Algiphilus aromaticivorans TaxID=382454 RepID=UPI000A763BC6|nr:3-hydroxyacyl-ACP dehydratase FabZ [Algiphilus aromaticivorans]
MSTGESGAADSGVIGIDEIMRALPHRYPFALLDRVIECVPGEHAAGLKNVTINEPFFQGHFPDAPIMPGVLILESLAQLSGILAIRTEVGRTREPSQKLYFAGIDDARFKRPVVPGDQLRLETTLQRSRRDIWRFSARASVDGKLAAEGILTCALKSA